MWSFNLIEKMIAGHTDHYTIEELLVFRIKANSETILLAYKLMKMFIKIVSDLRYMINRNYLNP